MRVTNYFIVVIVDRTLFLPPVNKLFIPKKGFRTSLYVVLSVVQTAKIIGVMAILPLIPLPIAILIIIIVVRQNNRKPTALLPLIIAIAAIITAEVTIIIILMKPMATAAIDPVTMIENGLMIDRATILAMAITTIVTAIAGVIIIALTKTIMGGVRNMVVAITPVLLIPITTTHITM